MHASEQQNDGVYLDGAGNQSVSSSCPRPVKKFRLSPLVYPQKAQISSPFFPQNEASMAPAIPVCAFLWHAFVPLQALSW